MCANYLINSFKRPQMLAEVHHSTMDHLKLLSRSRVTKLFIHLLQAFHVLHEFIELLFHSCFVQLCPAFDKHSLETSVQEASGRF